MMKENKIKKDIADLERGLQKGDISSGYKLYLMYENGISEKNANGDIICILEKNHIVAENYLEQCKLELDKLALPDELGIINDRIFLSHLTLVDFRKFSHIKIKLDKKLTVFIGENGAGKTTIIDAISKSISWVGKTIVKKGGKGRPVIDTDVNVNSTTYAEVNTVIKLGDNTSYSASLFKTAKGADIAKNSKLEGLEELGGLFRAINNLNRKKGLKEQDFPILVSYSVNRTNIKSNKTLDSNKISSITSGSRFDAYDKFTDGTGNFSDFLEWFMILNNLAGGEIKERLDKARKRMNALEAAGADVEGNELWDIYLSAKSEFDELNNDFSNREEHIKNYDIVKRAILSSIPSFKDIFIDTDSGRSELKVVTDDGIINIFQTSQGQQVLLSVVADIVRRLIMLNPSLANPLLGQGIVLIDEVELHLHPKWQQEIVNSLTKTFLNIQFILTTHSPQVLSTVDKASIRQFTIDEYGNIQAVSPKFQTKGVKSADILGRLMSTDSVPDVEEARDTERFSEYLINQDIDSAKKILESLLAHFGEDHPVILDCKSQISLFEMRNKILEQKGKK
ncbi:retron Ec78 anti-phage system effector ATPase PtuA [Vibrio vulnificus]|uniref:retron Ec78 anti-phage system effector ATPase PtuA n=1 Tax=Vibrio vulnificus TaxID=672 RepID=UPI003EDB4850